MTRKNKLTIDDMHAIAKERGGKCLSTKYKGSHDKLRWRCSKGHLWKAIPYSILRGTWCQVCSYKKRGEARKLGVKKMHLLAARRGGKFLSKEYITAKTNHIWQCAKGHIWKATPDNIIRGRSVVPCMRQKESE